VLKWLSIAEECFADEYGSLRRGLLTSVFAILIGMERIFHLDQMEDRGFAFLSGGRRCTSRHLVGGWRRHLTWYEVDRFCRRTSPWQWIRGKDALVSFDEHTIPRSHPQILGSQRVRHDPQQIHALRETVLRVRRRA
jgi:hypothetical protein